MSRRKAMAGLLLLPAAALAGDVRAVAAAGASPPRDVREWLLAPDRAAIDIPADYLGLHSDHGLGLPVPAPTYPYDAIRSHDVDNGHDGSSTQWADIETSRGQYDWRWIDRWIAAHEGRTRIWTLFGCPRFYQKYPGEPFPFPQLPGGGSPPRDPATAAAFIAALLARYPGKIQFVEIWNEPNFGPGHDPLRDRWTPDVAKAKGEPGWFTGTASELAQMARAVRKVLPAGVKLMAGAWVDQEADASAANSLLRFSAAPDGAGGIGRDHVEALSVHAYTTDFQPNGTITMLRNYEMRFAQAGYSAGLPRYVTEIGAEGDGHWTPHRPPMADKVCAIMRWGMIPAAMGYRGIYLYRHNGVRQLGDPAHVAELSAAIATLRNGVRGKRLVAGALLEDQTIWLSFADGSTLNA